MSRCVGVCVMLLRSEALAGDALGGRGRRNTLDRGAPQQPGRRSHPRSLPCGSWLSICAGCLYPQQQHCRRRGRFSTCRLTVLAAITVCPGFLAIVKAIVVSRNAHLCIPHIDFHSQHRSDFSQSLSCNGCRFITCFVTVFATVIALTKDLADIEGDRQYNIQTFATRLGPNRLALLGAHLRTSRRCDADESCFYKLTLGRHQNSSLLGVILLTAGQHWMCWR